MKVMHNSGMMYNSGIYMAAIKLHSLSLGHNIRRFRYLTMVTMTVHEVFATPNPPSPALPIPPIHAKACCLLLHVLPAGMEEGMQRGDVG